MALCNESCSSGQLAVLRGKNFNVIHYTQTFQPNVFIPAQLIGTIDFYHFMPLSLTLSQGGHKVSAKQNLFASFSPTFFN